MQQINKRNSAKCGIAIGVSSVAIGVVMIASSPARAALLVPGDTGPAAIVPTALAGGLPAGLPAGDVFVTSETKPFTGTRTGGAIVFEGTVTSAVYADPGNPAFGGAPGYDFVYQLTNNIDGMTPDDPIDRMTISSFASFLTDADYLTGTGDTAPTTADRNAGSGSIVGFNFPVGGAVLAPGNVSDYLIVETNALTFTSGTASVIDGGTGSTGAEAPAAIITFSVPEPATFGVIAVVTGMLLGRRRR